MKYHTCVKQCLEFVTKFKDETSWFFEVFHNINLKEKFEKLNVQLLQCTIDLSLGIDLKQIFDPQQDEADQEIDLHDIQSKLDEIAMMMVRRQEEKFGHYKYIKKHINERFSSFKCHLEKNIIRLNDPARAQEMVDEKHAFRHIPYYDLLQEEKIGEGAFADVYRGRWLSQDHEVAIKIIRIQYLREKVKKDFIKEISMMHKVHYDHILNMYGACTELDKYALVIEYMSLGSLYDVLKQQTIDLTWSNRWSIAYQMTKGINHLHTLPKPIIHRDIKSLNILLTERGQDILVKVSDFGLAKIRHETSCYDSEHILVGTLPWKAPELLKMGKHTEASDVYALGIVFWELATACEPYEDADEIVIRAFVLSGDRLEIPANVPNSFAELIVSAWTHEAQQRPTCQQLLHLIKENSSMSDVNKRDKVRMYDVQLLSSTSDVDRKKYKWIACPHF
ncbi:unnamed protein product [Rotaria sp. Silwood1]|nr:unnamed protein product [Rotaria sp. Silwood1]